MRNAAIALLLGLLSTGCSTIIDALGFEETGNGDIRLKTYDSPSGNTGEPTIDVVEVAAGRTDATATAPARVGVGVRTAGGPTPDTAYSHFCEVRATNTETQEERSVISQRHDGVDSTIVDGVQLSDVVVVEMPWGFYFEFPIDEWDPPDTIFEIFLGFLEVEGGAFLEDETGELEFDDTESLEDILSEIDEVFVPS